MESTGILALNTDNTANLLPMEGFPLLMQSAGAITLAFAKYGLEPAYSGNADIARFAFTAVASGEAVIQLTDVKVMDESLRASDYDPDILVNISVASQLIFPDKEENSWEEGEEGSQEETEQDGTIVVKVDSLKPDESGTILIQPKKASDKIRIEIAGEVWQEAARIHPAAVISVRSGSLGYHVPIGAIPLSGLTDRLVIQIEMRLIEEAEQQPMLAQLALMNIQIIGQLAEYKVTVSADGATADMNLGIAYIERIMILPGSYDSASATAVLLDTETGRPVFVPAIFRNNLEGATEVAILGNGSGIYGVVTTNKTFHDSQLHWAQTDIEWSVSKFIIEAESSTEFAPEHPVTRAEFTAYLVRSIGLSGSSGQGFFRDVDTSEAYSGSIGWAVQAGLVEGYDDGTFRPDSYITREEMTLMTMRTWTFISKLLQFKASLPASQEVLASFVDNEDISPWARSVMADAVAAGLIKGMPAALLSPQEAVDRAQAAVILRRMMELYDLP